MLLSELNLLDLTEYKGRKRDISKIDSSDSIFENRGNKVVLTPFKIEATSLQPIDGQTLQNLDEGLRKKARYVFYTPTPIRSVERITKDDKFFSDQIKIDGIWYSVYSVQDWNRTSFLSHNQCVAIQEDVNEMAGFVIEQLPEKDESINPTNSVTDNITNQKDLARFLIENETDLDPLPEPPPYPEFPDVEQWMINRVRLYLMKPTQEQIADETIALFIDRWLPVFPDNIASVLYNATIDCLRLLVFQTKGSLGSSARRRERVGQVEVEVETTDEYFSNWEWLLDQYLRGLIPIEGRTTYLSTNVIIGGVDRREIDRINSSPNSVNGLRGFSVNSNTRYGHSRGDWRY